MARSRHYKGNNEGGYGNPPVKNQFDGSTPGPGRPKGSKKSIEAALRKAYSTPIEVKARDGTKTFVNPIDSIAIRSIQLGMTGKARDNERAIELARKYGPQEEAAIVIDLSSLNSTELMLYGYIAHRATNTPAELFDPEDLQFYKKIEERLKDLDEEFFHSKKIK